MSVDRTYERALQVAERINALLEQGYGATQIHRITGHSIELVRRVMGGKGVFVKLSTEYLKGLPTINERAAAEIRKTGWPSDEEQTTQEIYAAAEAIRQKNPRDPVGHRVAFLEVPLSTVVVGR